VAAYASIASSSYNGPWKGFTFSSYVTLHQAAHNELLDLNEPVSETKKVTDFLKGIRDPDLNTGKLIVLGDPTKLEDFENCQQYLSTIVANLGNQAKAERHIVAVYTSSGGGGSLVDKIKGRSYTDEQFQSLSPEEKKQVLKFCEEAKKKKSQKWKRKRRGELQD
jgi:flavorubredoxin